MKKTSCGLVSIFGVCCDKDGRNICCTELGASACGKDKCSICANTDRGTERMKAITMFKNYLIARMRMEKAEVCMLNNDVGDMVIWQEKQENSEIPG